MSWYVRFILIMFSFIGYLLRPTEVKAATNWQYGYYMNGTTLWFNTSQNFSVTGYSDTVVLSGSFTGYGVISSIAINIPTLGDIPCYYSVEYPQSEVSFTAICKYNRVENISFNSGALVGYIAFDNNANLSVTGLRLGSGLTYFDTNGYTSSLLENISGGVNSSAGDLARLFLTASDMDRLLNDILYTLNSSNSGYTAIKNAIDTQSQQQHQDSQDEQNAINNNTQAIEDVNDTLNDDSVDTDQAGDFFGDFQNDDHGLSSIITAPLRFIENLASSSCSPIHLTIPFINQSFDLPCMSAIYSQFGNVLTIYQTITFGIVAYYVCVNIFALVKGFKDPQDDRIEVVAL